MEIKTAKYSSFCFGVKKAVEAAERLLKKGGKDVFSIGDIIHNPSVVSALSSKGLKVCDGLNGLSKGTLIVRTHGLSPGIIDEAVSRGIKVADATCPLVKKSQGIVKALNKGKYHVIIVGNARHPEVEALKGFAEGGVTVIGKTKELEGCRFPSDKVGVIAQSTYGEDKYIEIVSGIMRCGFKEIKVYNTICSDTIKRQKAASELAKKVEVMLVVGGMMSSNTKLLADICRAAGVETHHIEGADQLDMRWFAAKEQVGIVGGASTPNYTIEEIIKKIKKGKVENRC
ncbi:MAG: 4-hydroxy-3-methylbut-2-enyl diphosphate reductase [Candidatus Omnitrophica bacterium CG1_02_49_10]|nr:MAG: 4-hydroxy-3-methylbut-2-enyl diphosphate reductase [Candidatus Omnitrophica bacterium CG1_02_49_10]